MSVRLAQRSTSWTEDPQGAGHLRGASDAPGPVPAGVPEIRQVRLVRAVCLITCASLSLQLSDARVPTCVCPDSQKYLLFLHDRNPNVFAWDRATWSINCSVTKKVMRFNNTCVDVNYTHTHGLVGSCVLPRHFATKLVFLSTFTPPPPHPPCCPFL